MSDFGDAPFTTSDFVAIYGTPASASSAPAPPAGPQPPPPGTTIRIGDRTRRMVDTSVRAFPVVVLVGAPGTGKGAILTDLIERVKHDPASFGFDAHVEPRWPDPLKRTPDEGTSPADLAGGHVPDGAGGTLRWGSGAVLDALAADRWLILDELNRGDLDKILGPLLTWLAGETVELGNLTPATGSPRIVLGWDDDRPDSYVDPPEGLDADPATTTEVVFRAGRDFRVLGTYNPLDAKRVFSMGLALGRRLRQVPIAVPDRDDMKALLDERFPNTSESMRERIVKAYVAHQTANEKTALGPALFLEMPRYVVSGLLRSGLAENAADEPLSSELLQEAYVVCVGRYLRNYGPDARTALTEAPDLEEALGAGGVEWVGTAVKDL
jgi:MoxR-like ATPase